MDTLEPNESGWWYRISDPIRFRECKACRKRIGEDVQTGHKTLDTGVCPKCLIRKPQRERSTSKKQGGNKQVATDKIVGARRSLRLSTQVLPENVYHELDEDVYMDSDDDLDQEMQQDHLCVSTDPRRVGGTGGKPTIINIEELRALLITQQSLEDQTVWLTTTQAGFPVTADATELQNDRDRLLGKPVAHFLHPTISIFIQDRLEELNSKRQAPSHMEQLAKRLEETWGRA
jgi:hypothetical protein